MRDRVTAASFEAAKHHDFGACDVLNDSSQGAM